jgi:hypothetical protein
MGFHRLTLLTFVIICFAGACTSDPEVNSPEKIMTETPLPATAEVLTEENNPSEGEATGELLEEVSQVVEATPTSVPYPTPTVTAGTQLTETNAAYNPIVEIPLAGPVAESRAQISGLAWYSDTLIMLPQFPNFSTDIGDGFVYALPKVEIVDFLDGRSVDPLEPQPIPFVDPGIRSNITGYEGYEAIAFAGDVFYVTIESEAPDGMLGYLAKGTISPDLEALTLDTASPVAIAPQTDIENMSEESLFVAGQAVGTIYELNGAGVNDFPVVHLFDLGLTPIGTPSFPHVDFRLTDTTELDQEDRFWAINYFFPVGENWLQALELENDNIDDDGPRWQWVGMGRLIEFQYSQDGISLTDSSPIQLELQLSDIHNWEGLARFDKKGFLIASDENPDTVLGFVPFPGE